MKVRAIELPKGKSTSLYGSRKIIILILSFLLLLIPIYVYFNSYSSVQSLKIVNNGSFPPGNNPKDSTSIRKVKKCDIYRGNWVPHPKGPYYTNATKCVIDDRQNCMKFGRPDTEFMKWSWKPDECELPLFDAARFLEIVRGKSLAFVGDSLARNQMQSLVCLLTSVANPVDVSYVKDTRFRRWLFIDYNFTLASFWSTHLVKSRDADPNGHSLNSIMNLYLDQVDDSWATQVENFDFVIISAGQWFSRPFIYYENGKVVGCHICQKENITSLSRFYGYRMAFRTAFRSLISLGNFKGLTFLRTFSPQHFENGEWNKGGNCRRTRPLTKEEMKLDMFVMEFYFTQVDELRKAEKEAERKGLKFRLLDITEVMLWRPDGHPNHYGHWPDENVDVPDCVHWCMPGPVDTWNQFLLHMLKLEAEI